MATSIRLIHPQSGMTKTGYVGFSWTYMFFGWIVPIFRGEMTTALLHLIFSIFTFLIFHIVEMFYTTANICAVNSPAAGSLIAPIRTSRSRL